MAVASLDSTRESIHVATTWSEKDLVRQIPGARAIAHDPHAGIGYQTWKLPLTWGACMTLRGVFRANLEISEDLQKWAWKHKQQIIDPALILRSLTEWPSSWPRNPNGPESDSRFFPFQAVGAHFLQRADGALLGDEQGAGKTITTLAALELLLTLLQLPALIVSPNSVKKHWEDRIRVWYPEATPYVVTGSAANRRKILAAAKKDPTAIVIVNYEAMRLLSRLAPYGSIRLKRCIECDPRSGNGLLKVAQCEVHQKELNGFGFKTAIVDEIHRVGDPKSKQTRAIWAVLHEDTVKYRWGLTGTLFDRPEALWSLLHTIAPKEFPTRTTFMDRYMLFGWNAFGAPNIIGFNPDTREELFSIIDAHFRRMPKALVLEQLPPKLRSVRVAPMTPAQKRMYNELKDGLVTTTESGETWVVPTNLAMRTRLLQLASASIELEKPDPDDISTWIVTLTEPAPKLNVLEEIVDELGDKPFVVAAPHRQLVELTHERLLKRGVKCKMITGKVNTDDRHRALEELNRGDIQCIVFVMKAGGEGLDMSKAGTLIRIQRSHSLLENKQAEDRAHRIGSEIHDNVHIIDIVAEGTIEEDQIELLNAKLTWLEEINRDRAKLLQAGYSEHSPQVTSLEEMAQRIEAIDLFEELGKEESTRG